MRSIALLLVLAGCEFLDVGQTEYYGDAWSPPAILSLSSAAEVGNLGGSQLVIAGGGFGTDPAGVLVQFGDKNARILSISDTELVVVVPPGPLTGGAVRVRVATATGFADSTYAYDVQSTTQNQTYIQVSNYFQSCYGGLSDRVDASCADIAYIGSAGIDGYAERLSFAYPRIESTVAGFFGGSDYGPDSWTIERPGAVTSWYEVANNVQDLRGTLGSGFTLSNAYGASKDAVCVDLDATATYTYSGGGGNSFDPYSFRLSEVPKEESGDTCKDLLYGRGTLQFCQRDDVTGVPSRVYRPDWPVPYDFFQANKNDDEPATVTLDVPELGIVGQPLTLPEPIITSAEQGFGDAGEVAWTLIDPDRCFADTEDGEKLDDVALQLSWPITQAELTTGGNVESARTYVRASLTVLTVGWLGGMSYPVRATITVPDNVNKEKSTAYLNIPSSVLYQIPTTLFPPTGALATSDPTYGYLIAEIQRVTDYTLCVGGGEGCEDGDERVMFSYVTGDFGFYSWENPVDADGCHNCVDDDDDGYADADDPDCDDDGTEEVGYGTSQCNDGVDNDGDHRTDVDDTDCRNAADEDESNCTDGKDNDGDGLEDELDPECVDGSYEHHVDGCVNGLDDDEDGWMDADDPDCAVDTEEFGFGTTTCNDDLDNDEDGATDAMDADCATALDDEGVAVPVSCADGLDDDADGWTDGADPDCTTGTAEIGFGTTQCNDSEDNDGDGATDALDAECTDAEDDDEGV